mmetsp:Transcript_12472/g.38551  ORF Transcript_12472/g.38551 Transcript_12472/m.38551 type:complete len:251 (-) Transcript_12472:185-937(-)
MHDEHGALDRAQVRVAHGAPRDDAPYRAQDAPRQRGKVRLNIAGGGGLLAHERGPEHHRHQLGHDGRRAEDDDHQRHERDFDELEGALRLRAAPDQREAGYELGPARRHAQRTIAAHRVADEVHGRAAARCLAYVRHVVGQGVDGEGEPARFWRVRVALPEVAAPSVRALHVARGGWVGQRARCKMRDSEHARSASRHDQRRDSLVREALDAPHGEPLLDGRPLGAIEAQPVREHCHRRARRGARGVSAR